MTKIPFTTKTDAHEFVIPAEALREELEELESLRAAVDRVREAALATFNDPLVAPASAATAERILRALDGKT